MLARERGSNQDGGGEGQQLEGACSKALNVAEIQPRGRLSKHSGDCLDVSPDAPSADPELALVCWLLVLHTEPRPLVSVEHFEQPAAPAARVSAFVCTFCRRRAVAPRLLQNQEYDFGPGHLEKIMDKKDHTNTKGGWKKKMGSSKKKDWIGLN
ncbi:hypothetical protein D4764_19G0008390 [Takifugu flavidus]|uniref:Uncharacterized protein n=1 Tax=Takifugu flavidus TaxID=433684 RepID=A0A5C6NR15_9TELE|nr:hypothetical protein D4764_19G0008390 [Takifugu flavidus]